MEESSIARLLHTVVPGSLTDNSGEIGPYKLGFTLLSPFLKTNIVLNLMSDMLSIPPEDRAQFKNDLKMTSIPTFKKAFFEAMDLRFVQGLERVGCPTLFIVGEKEGKGMFDGISRALDVMPYAQLYVFPNEGHEWSARHPNAVSAAIEAWLHDRALPTPEFSAGLRE